MQRLVDWHGSLWKVDAAGFYQQLITLPLAACRTVETGQNWQKVERYAQMYRAGSPFPPISVCGATLDDPLYPISDGHHRWLAARRAQAGTIQAWMCFYHPVPVPGGTFWALARMSDTAEGQALARHIGMVWCPRCKHFLNYTPGEPMCLSCKIAQRT